MRDSVKVQINFELAQRNLELIAELKQAHAKIAELQKQIAEWEEASAFVERTIASHR